MLDRNSDGRSEFGMDDDFHDDFHDDLGEFNPSKAQADPLNPNFDDMDNFSLEGSEPNPNPNDVANRPNLNLPPNGGFMETIKTYGIVMLVVLVVGYFGIKYSLKAIMPQKTVNQIAEDSGDAAAPDLNIATNQLPLAPAVTADNSLVLPTTVTTTTVLPETLPVTEQQVLPPTITPVSSPSDNAINANANNNMAAASPELKQDIESLKKALNDLTQQLTTDKDLSDNGLKDVKQQVQQLVIYMQGVGKGVSILSSELSQQQKVLEGMLAGVPMPKSSTNQNNTTASNSSTKDNNAHAQNNNVVVEAVIAGRAWIKTSNTGKTLSVGIGDVIPGYGKVIDINQVKATITTDTGSELSLQK